MTRYNLVLWGTGKRTQTCLSKGYLSKHNILGIIDTHKTQDMFFNIPVYTPEKLNDLLEKAN